MIMNKTRGQLWSHELCERRGADSGYMAFWKWRVARNRRIYYLKIQCTRM